MWEFWRSALGKTTEMRERKKRVKGTSLDAASQAARMFSAPADKVKEVFAGMREENLPSTTHIHFKVRGAGLCRRRDSASGCAPASLLWHGP